MKYAICTLVIEYHRLACANRQIEQITSDPDNWNGRIKANEDRMKEIEEAIKILQPAENWKL